jgi:hypothetical protein
MNKVEISIIGEANYMPKTVMIIDHCLVSVSMRMIAQVIDSSKYVTDLKSSNQHFILLAKISSTFLQHIVSGIPIPDHVPMELDLSGWELSAIKGWLIAKHDHCEKNREAPEFNVDTFYYLKDLILTIREMLISKLEK